MAAGERIWSGRGGGGGRDQISSQEGVMTLGRSNIRCFTRLPSDHIQYGHQGQRTPPRPGCQEASLGVFFFVFSWLFFPKETGTSQQLRWYFTKCFHCGLWSGRSLSRLLQRFDGETVASPDQPVVEGWRVRGVPWWGSAWFQDRSGKDCLKIFLAEELARGRETEESFKSFRGGTRMTKNIANNLSACLLRTWRRQHLCLSQPLSKSYFTFWMDLFFCKKEEKKKKKEMRALCKGSCQLQ